MIANARVFYGRRNFTMSEGERAELRVLSLSVAPLTEAKQKRMDALLHRARTETTVEFSETLASARIPIPGGKHLTDHAGRRKHEGLAFRWGTDDADDPFYLVRAIAERSCVPINVVDDEEFWTAMEARVVAFGDTWTISALAVQYLFVGLRVEKAGRNYAATLKEARGLGAASSSPDTEVEILLTALREYQDAATAAFMVYRPEGEGAGAVMRRKIMLGDACSSILDTLRPLRPIDDIPSRVELVRRVFGLSTGGRPWMDAVMTDLLLRLHGERGRIPELP